MYIQYVYTYVYSLQHERLECTCNEDGISLHCPNPASKWSGNDSLELPLQEAIQPGFMKGTTIMKVDHLPKLELMAIDQPNLMKIITIKADVNTWLICSISD